MMERRELVEEMVSLLRVQKLKATYILWSKAVKAARCF